MQLPANLCAFVPLISLSLLSTSAAETNLRYKFQSGTTNGYRVTIESVSENNPRRVEGIILVGVRTVEDNVATLFFRGRLQPKQGANAPQHFAGHMFHPGHFGQPDPWQQFFFPSALSPYNEVQVDSSGRVLRIVGLQDLPRPLDNLATLLLPILPASSHSTNPVATESTLVLDEEPSGRGPHMPAFHRGMHGHAPGRLAGIRKETSRYLETTNGLPRIANEVEFRSHAKTDGAPRLALKTKSEAILDPTTCLIQSLKLEGNSAVSTLDLLRKFALVATVEMVTGEELTRAVDEAAEKSPNLSEAEVDTLLAQIKQDDQRKRSEAAKRLLAADLDAHAKTMLPILMPFFNEDDHLLKMLAGRILAKAATEEHLPILYRFLKQDDAGHHHEVIQALGRIGHKDSIQVLADIIAYGNNNAYAASEALGQYGSAAEDAALALLKEKHLETRRQACQILNKVGTAKSIETLQAIIAAGDPQLINEATQSLREIRQRGEAASNLFF